MKSEKYQANLIESQSSSLENETPMTFMLGVHDEQEA